jgi:hypothetical protein
VLPETIASRAEQRQIDVKKKKKMAPPTSPSALEVLVSRTLADPPTRIVARQGSTITVISETYETTETHTLSGGAIAGIVIGSILGLILIILLIWWATRSNQSQDGTGPPPRRGRHYHYHYRHHHQPGVSVHHSRSASPRHSHSRSRSRSHSRHYRNSVEVVRPAVSEPQRVYVTQEPRYHSRGRQEWRG